jgi:hypothetical protein
VHGSGESHPVAFFLNGIDRSSINFPNKEVSFKVGISDAESSFDTSSGSVEVKVQKYIGLGCFLS